MGRIAPKTETAPAGEAGLYERDFFRWNETQGALLRQGRLSAIDIANLADEIESLGRDNKHEIDSRLTVLMANLLKWQFQPSARSASWESTLLEQRTRILRLIEESPSLAGYPATRIDAEYPVALLKAAGEVGLP